MRTGQREEEESLFLWHSHLVFQTGSPCQEAKILLAILLLHMDLLIVIILFEATPKDTSDTQSVYL